MHLADGFARENREVNVFFVSSAVTQDTTTGVCALGEPDKCVMETRNSR